MRYVLSVLLLLFSLPATAAEVTRSPVIDFRDAFPNNMNAWLKATGFTFEQSAGHPSKARFTATEPGMLIEALKPSQAILMFHKGQMTNVRDIDITWGVNTYPKGANWDNGRRNEAIMIYAFFGTERIDSGSAFIPDSPYFLALRLCEKDQVGVLHKGGYFHAGGRFICLASPRPGEIMTTRYNLRAAYLEAFGHNPPPLTAIGVEFDTSSSGNGGKASAILQKIAFPGATYIRN